MSIMLPIHLLHVSEVTAKCVSWWYSGWTDKKAVLSQRLPCDAPYLYNKKIPK